MTASHLQKNSNNRFAVALTEYLATVPSQQQFAEKCGLSPSALSLIASGARSTKRENCEAIVAAVTAAAHKDALMIAYILDRFPENARGNFEISGSFHKGKRGNNKTKLTSKRAKTKATTTNEIDCALDWLKTASGRSVAVREFILQAVKTFRATTDL